ncbi:MucR family transcriptional regulator [Sphingobium yanoikuyae]|uniref:MucR family transcriptional regulator n=1 Tax=Sphingobium yanoikuyae TaxID=13690 RepID=A0AA42WSW1_SPHYA|nr:MucR family transcriptional regulator [Sphingobium yanoikuyae]MDH2129557.1 MucR family transcriptional regulator [Sphingobium yanoikuyae]MDH2149014.1 MucR family transcriptional regulator [Sphingobium yanoikuyae]MDH2167680.1 MucR family transcriptional regulator [Sphingobium yanoikuyae]
MADTEQPDLTAMTVQLLSAYFSNNQVPASDIAGIIEATRGALEGKGEAETPAPVEHVPAVSVRKSLGSREHLISMIDGKPYKTLKRHLATNGLTPAEYRERYKLPRDYPMVAPAYSEHRRAVAAKLGLGRKAGETAQKEAPVAEQAVQEAAPMPAPVKEQKPKRTSRKANTATPADEVAAIALEQTPKSAPEKPKRTRATAANTKPAIEASVIAVETPEAAPMASATPGVSAAAAPAPAPAPAPRKAKGAATKSVAKKPAAKKASPKTSSGAKKPAAAKEAAAPSPETQAPEAAKTESSAPAPRKKKLGIVTGAKSAASPKAKTSSKRTNAVKKDAAQVDTPASTE